MVVPLVHTWTIFEGVNKTGDIVWSYGDDKGVRDDGQHTNTFENPMPDTWQAKQKKKMCFNL